MTWRELLERATAALLARHEALIVLEEAAGTRFSALVASLDERASDEGIERFEQLLKRRTSGEPLQHVVGHWPFRHVDLLVDERALIPRPETEIVVEHVLCALERHRDADALLAVDLGTGTGAIACALVDENDDVKVIAVDTDERALQLAQLNVARLSHAKNARIELLRSDFYQSFPDALRGKVTVIVSNPPYLSCAEWHLLDPVVKDYDPKAALVSGETGLEAFEAVLRDAPQFLVKDGAVVLEIAPHQTRAVRELAQRSGAHSIEVHRDLAERERVLVARYR
jgi:release factor glutamine methyltransferase